MEPDQNSPATVPPGTALLAISVDQEDGRTTMILAGELDASTAPALRERLVEVGSDHEGDLVLHIGSLTFIDSSGLALFIAQHKKQQSQGSEFLISAATPMARRLFQITGLSDVFSVVPVE